MTDSTKIRISAVQPPSAGACLNEDDLLAFAMGRLEVSRIAQVHQHLDGCEVCQFLVSDSVHGLANLGNADTARLAREGRLSSEDEARADIIGSKTTFQVGSLVAGRYRIRRFIIDGGMGEVYEAFDCDLQEPVALKTVKSTISDQPRAVRWLKGEVQLARRVSHANVCRIYDIGTHTMPETGAVVSFLTMEFVEGETLGLRVRLNGALPVGEACGVARQLLLGLSAAHEAGVLHRDFKSDNVMLRSDATARVSAVILDFGLARRLHHDVKSSSSALVGTFGYIAPEQLEGKPYTRASDVYAFGVVWYEMLTGDLPFGDDGYAAEAALPPSTRNRLVPRELDALVLKCIRRAPKDRFKSAEEVLRALAAVRPARLGVGTAVAIAAAALLCTLAVYFLGFYREPARPSTAVTLNAALPQQPLPAPSVSSVGAGVLALASPAPANSAEKVAHAAPSSAAPPKAHVRAVVAAPTIEPSAIPEAKAPPAPDARPAPSASSKGQEPAWEPL